MANPPPSSPQEILKHAKRIAVVGCSATPGKPAHDIPKYLLEHGYEIVPVNPTVDSVFGLKAYKSLAEVPGPIDLVNVFRRAPDTPDVAREAVQVGAKALWLQSGIANPETRAIAEEGGLAYVEDRCTMVEHTQI